MQRRNDFTVYDKNDQSTWPPGEGLDVLVCYRNKFGELVWTIDWSNYGYDHGYAAMLDHGTDWSDLAVQFSPWVAWRHLSAEKDAPTDEAAAVLDDFYVLPPAAPEYVEVVSDPPELAVALAALNAEAGE